MSWVQIPFPAPSRHLDDLAVTGALRWPTTSSSCFASGLWPPRSDAARGLVGSNPISRSLPTSRRFRCDWRLALAHDRRTTHGRARRSAPSVVSPARLSPCRRARAAGRWALNDRPPPSGGAPVHGKCPRPIGLARPHTGQGAPVRSRDPRRRSRTPAPGRAAIAVPTCLAHHDHRKSSQFSGGVRRNASQTSCVVDCALLALQEGGSGV